MTHRRRSALLGSLVAAVALGALPQLSHAGQKALVIGINAYPNMPAKYQLRGSRPDALAMKKFLLEHWGFSASDVRTLLDEEASKEGIMDGLNSWLPDVTEPGDRIVVYFSGHGTQVPDTSGDEADGQDEAWSPSDIGRRSGHFVNEQVTDDEIAAAFRRLSGREVLLISDSCHSGTLARGSGTETSPDVADVKARYIPPPADAVPTETIQVRDEDQISRESGAHLTLSAAMPHQYSWDSGSGGIFTRTPDPGVDESASRPELERSGDDRRSNQLHEAQTRFLVPEGGQVQERRVHPQSGSEERDVRVDASY